MTSPMPYVPPFKITPHRYTLHNARPEAFKLRWGGMRFTIPPVDEVGPKAAKFDDGTPIPGTAVLQDAAAPGHDGVVTRRAWSAETAIREVLGIDIETGQAVGMAAKAGVSFLPDAPNRHLVARIREDGERRWNESQIEWAEHEVAAQMAGIEKAKEAGVAPPLPGPEYRKAVQVLERYHKKLDDTFGRTVDAAVESVTHDDEIELAIYMKAAAMQMAEGIAKEKEVDQSMLAEEMLKDPKIRKHLQKKYRIRKVGHTDVPDEPAPPQTIEIPKPDEGPGTLADPFELEARKEE